MKNISVIVATCNRPERLKSVLDRLSGIDNPFELVIVDNGEGALPFDLAPSSVKALAPSFKTYGDTCRLGVQGETLHVRYLRSTPRNKCEALNTGIKAAKSEWLAFTDDDCLPDDKWLEEAEKYIEHNPDIKIFGGRVIPGPAIGKIPKWLKMEDYSTADGVLRSNGQTGTKRDERRSSFAEAQASEDKLTPIKNDGSDFPPSADKQTLGDLGAFAREQSFSVSSVSSVRNLYSSLPRGPAIVDYDPMPQSGVLPDNAQVPLGANIFVHKSVFDKCGMYDVALWNRLGKYALGCDDAEFAMRVRKCGYRIGYCRESVVNHPVHEERATVRNHLKWAFSFGVKDVVIFPEDADRKLIPYYLKMIIIDLFKGLFVGRTAKGVCELMDAFKYLGRLRGMIRYGR